MRTRRLLALITILAVVGILPASAEDPGAPVAGPGDDLVVIAVVDSGFSPYHLNFRADLMPQQLDGDPSNDLPLDVSPEAWLPGYAMTDDVTSFDSISMTLPDDGGANVEALEDVDNVHAQMPESDAGDVHVRWMPGTKIIGAVDFRGGEDGFFGSNTSHGNGTSSVAAGNIHGTCPECLLVLIRYDGSDELEAANDWAYSQPWIDVVTSSFGYSTLPRGRDRIYDGANTELQREASERGQSIFFSAGNGQANTFTAPNTTYQSSQEGPDWIITVGGTAPNGHQYTGAGKSADMASIGSGYPSGYGGATVSGSGSFGGTSNATPVAAGTYARALWQLREAMHGASRTQADGMISTGDAACGEAVAECAIGDGVLTVDELRFGYLQSLVRTPEGLTPMGIVGGPGAPGVAEEELAAEGHGTLFGRLDSAQNWLAEVAAVTGPLRGDAAPLERTQEERDWMVVDSFCRQEVHGAWEGGYYVEGETDLPTLTGPLTALIQAGCPTAFGVLKDAGTDTPGPTGQSDDQR